MALLLLIAILPYGQQLPHLPATISNHRVSLTTTNLELELRPSSYACRVPSSVGDSCYAWLSAAEYGKVAPTIVGYIITATHNKIHAVMFSEDDQRCVA